MKQIFLTLFLLLLTLLPAGAVKKFEPHPINVGAVIVAKTDSIRIASICEYYGFAYQGVEDGYTIMKRPNGNEIRFTFNENGTRQLYPTVMVKSKGTHKKIEDCLKRVNFEKEGNLYTIPYHKYQRFITQCAKGPRNTMIFRRLSNPSHK